MKKAGLAAGALLGAYNAVYKAAYLGLWPAVRSGLVGEDWRWEERMGQYPPIRGAGPGPRIWMHAASVGETKSASALARALLARDPDSRLVVSTMTAAGFKSAGRLVQGAEAVVQAPVDLRGPVRRALSWFDPSLFIVVETEIWPNVILECNRRGTPLAMASAKVSDRSYHRYAYVRPLMRYVLSGVACAAAQTGRDRDRLCRLGLEPDNVEVTGDLKLDAQVDGSDVTPPAWLSAAREGRRLIAAGSTRPGEEEAIGRALLAARDAVGATVIAVVAPRHIERCPDVARRLRELGLKVVLRSALGGSATRAGDRLDVVLLDTIGELAGVYPGCDIAFVGGTLAPHGGHNVAEPAAAGVPVLFGPSVESVRIVAEALVASGGGAMVTGVESLAGEIAKLLSDSVERARRAEAAARTVESLRGAAVRTVQLFERYGMLPGAG
jgi:3-deoxy-D-manno-octulosonic-acid transferase